MGVGILAPVPAVHLKSALLTCEAMGRVAFGSEAWEVFDKASTGYGSGLPVLIYATPHHGDPDHLSDAGYVRFRATYFGTKLAQAGTHPDPSIRPSTTLGPDGDGRWSFFWEVSSLKHLPSPERIAIMSLTAAGQKKPLTNKFTLHGPMLVTALFL